MPCIFPRQVCVMSGTVSVPTPRDSPKFREPFLMLSPNTPYAQRVIELPFRLHSGAPTDARLEELPDSASPVTPTIITCTGAPRIGGCKTFCRTLVYRSTVFRCEASRPATDRGRVSRTGTVLFARWSLGLRRRSSDCCCTDRSQPPPEWQRRGQGANVKKDKDRDLRGSRRSFLRKRVGGTLDMITVTLRRYTRPLFGISVIALIRFHPGLLELLEVVWRMGSKTRCGL